jgi:hypothetical protein
MFRTCLSRFESRTARKRSCVLPGRFIIRAVRFVSPPSFFGIPGDLKSGENFPEKISFHEPGNPRKRNRKYQEKSPAGEKQKRGVVLSPSLSRLQYVPLIFRLAHHSPGSYCQEYDQHDRQGTVQVRYLMCSRHNPPPNQIIKSFPLSSLHYMNIHHRDEQIV